MAQSMASREVIILTIEVFAHQFLLLVCFAGSVQIGVGSALGARPCWTFLRAS